jgi:hypothetical protein
MLKANPEALQFHVVEQLNITLTLLNELKSSIYFETFGKKWEAYNGETVNCRLVDIYREGDSGQLYLARPELKLPSGPPGPSGLGVIWVKPGASAKIQLDMSKWKIRGGWIPGEYQVNCRIDRITVDRHISLSVMADPISFEILPN